MAEELLKSKSEVLKRGYSDEELDHIFALGRLMLEAGQIKKGEGILSGLVEIAPDYWPAWLGLSYSCIQNKDYEKALQSAIHAHKINPDSVEIMLYMIACFLTVGDRNSAGTYLGEVGDRIDNNLVANPSAVRFYKLQLARFQTEQ